MAMSVTYTTIHGRIMAESRDGVVTQFVHDTAGNVIMTTDDSGNITSETSYWPFGEIRSQSGSNPSPFGFQGAWGYMTDDFGQIYVRARYYRSDESRWQTVDPLWPIEQAYTYCNQSPLTMVDPTGTCCQPNAIEFIWQITTPSVAAACACCIHFKTRPETDLVTKRHVGGRLFPPGTPRRDAKINALRHCYWACTTVRQCGCSCSNLIYLKEEMDERHTPEDSLCDRRNNCSGQKAASLPGSCLDNCYKAYLRGALCMSTNHKLL